MNKKNRQKIFRSILESMIAMAYCDDHYHDEEAKVIERFRAQHKLPKTLTSKRQPISLGDATKTIIRAIGLIDEIDQGTSKGKFKFTLLDQLQRIAEADEEFHLNEKHIIRIISQELGLKLSFSKARIETWNKQQKKVLKEPVGSRLVVPAPPGAGKTELIAEQVIRFVFEENVAPRNILLVSFTNSAVREMQDRIFMRSQDGEYPYGVQVLTLDKHAFMSNRALYEDYKPTGDYEKSLTDFLELLEEENFDLIERWEEMQHVFIDEAQDLYGVRKDICLKLIELASETTGISVYGDQAQQIYPWDKKKQQRRYIRRGSSQATGREKIDKTSLMDVVDDNITDLNFVRIELSKIHRTDDLELLALNDKTRSDIMLIGDDGGSDKIKNRAFETIETFPRGDDSFTRDATHNTLLLFRWNRNLVDAAHNFLIAGQPFRITPTKGKFRKYYLAWLGSLLDYCASHDIEILDFKDFRNAINSMSVSTFMTIDNTQLLWNRMLRVAESDYEILIKYLKERLAVVGPVRLSEYANKFHGRNGPILSTVHAAKGSQALHVMLDSTSLLNKSTIGLDEAKVIFVAITRARKTLSGFKPSTSIYSKTVPFAGEMKNNKHAGTGMNRILKRALTNYKTNVRKRAVPIFGMEVGLNGDYDPTSIVSYSLGSNVIERTQNLLREGTFLQSDYECFAIRERSKLEYTIKLVFEGQEFVLGEFTDQVYENFANSIKFNYQKLAVEPPTTLRNLRIMDVATHITNDEAQELVNNELKRYKTLKQYQEREHWLYPIVYGNGPFVCKRLK